jgi:putative IMPACT (imprinted ancient) family translation regulator
LANILVVVVRYFGGTKLGVSGLISAYKKTAQLALEQSDIITKTIDNQYLLTFSYVDLNKILRILKNSSAKILTQNMEMECKYNISIRKSENDSFIKALEESRCVIWTRLN